MEHRLSYMYTFAAFTFTFTNTYTSYVYVYVNVSVFVNVNVNVPDFLDKFSYTHRRVTIEVEAKAKELAVERLGGALWLND